MILKLHERECLDEYVILAPIVDAVVSQMMGVGARSISCCSGDDFRHVSDWSVFEDSAGRGVGIHLNVHTPHATVLQRRFALLQQTRLLASAMESLLAEGPLHLREDGVCPATWRIFHVEVGGKKIGCAVSHPTPALRLPHTRRTLRDRIVTMPLHAACMWNGPVSVGVSQSISEVAFALGEGDIRGVLMCRGEEMVMKQSEDVTQEGKEPEVERIPVRLDLGEIHLSIDQLLELRRGMEVGLESTFPLRCYLRVGMSAVAEGVLEPESDGMRVTIVDIV